MKLPRRNFLHLAAGASLFVTAGAHHGFPGGSAAMSPFSQQLEYKCILGHEAFGIQPSGSEGA